MEFQNFRTPNEHIEFQKNSFFSRQKKKREIAGQQTIGSISTISQGRLTEYTKNTDSAFPFTQEAGFDEVSLEFEGLKNGQLREKLKNEIPMKENLKNKSLNTKNFDMIIPEISRVNSEDSQSEKIQIPNQCFRKVEISFF